jgi:hypothetical protein
MSHRPIEQKKLARLRKALRRTPDAYIDLVDWLQTRGYADTAGQARKIILARRVKSESHVLGIVKMPQLVGNKVEDVDTVDQYVPARLRATLHVEAAK